MQRRNNNHLPLRERLYRWLKNQPNEWISLKEIEEICAAAGYKDSTCSTELLSLAKEKSIEREQRDEGIWYRWSGKDDYDTEKEIAWFNKLECQCKAPEQCTRHF